jgi:hypothetical protein
MLSQTPRERRHLPAQQPLLAPTRSGTTCPSRCRSRSSTRSSSSTSSTPQVATKPAWAAHQHDHADLLLQASPASSRRTRRSPPSRSHQEDLRQEGRGVVQELQGRGRALAAIRTKSRYPRPRPTSARSHACRRARGRAALRQERHGEIMANRGDELPVSAMPVDGTFPTGTTQYEKRNIALEIPSGTRDLHPVRQVLAWSARTPPSASRPTIPSRARRRPGHLQERRRQGQGVRA